MQDEIILHSPGAIPGIGGGVHGAGRYLIDWDARTATPVEALAPSEPEPTPKKKAAKASTTSEQAQ